jgi:hypothetical protein
VAPTAPTAAPVQAQSPYIAVEAATESTGAVVYWALSGNVAGAALAQKWDLPRQWLPVTASAEVALSRACNEQKSRHTLMRKDGANGYQLIFERVNQDQLSYSSEGRVSRLADTLQFEGLDEKTCEEIRAAYTLHRECLTPTDISGWLVGLMGEMGAVPLRERGGLYFVPRTQVATFRAIKGALAECSSHTLYEIPAMRSVEAMAAVIDAVRREAEEICSEIDGELNVGEIGSRAMRSRLEALDNSADKVRSYERLLGVSMEGLLARIAQIRGRVAQAATRGSLLETE